MLFVLGDIFGYSLFALTDSALFSSLQYLLTLGRISLCLLELERELATVLLTLGEEHWVF